VLLHPRLPLDSQIAAAWLLSPSTTMNSEPTKFWSILLTLRRRRMVIRGLFLERWFRFDELFAGPLEQSDVEAVRSSEGRAAGFG